MRINKNSGRWILYLSVVWHIFFYIFIFHLIELPGLLESWWTYKGLIYYRDFATFHFPLGRWLLLPFYILSNWNLHIGPTIGLFVNIASVTLIYKFGEKYWSKRANTLAVIFFSLFSWYLGTAIMFYHEMLVGLILLILFVYFAKNYHSTSFNFKTSFITGVLCALAELSGQIATPTLALFSVTHIGIALTAKNLKNKFSNILGFLIGAILPLSILTLYFLKNNAFQDFFEQNFLYYTTYADTYEKVPLLSLPLRELSLIYLPTFVSFALLIYLLVKKQKINFLFAAATLLVLSSIPFIVFSVFHFHHVSFILPLGSILVGFLFTEAFKNKTVKALYSPFAYLFVILLLLMLFPWYVKSVSRANVGRIANNLSVGDTMHQTVEWTRKNTPPDATILVAGDALFYFSADRNPSNKNAYVSPYNWEPLKKTIREVDDEPPDYWIINRTYFARLIKEYKKRAMVDYIENSLRESYSKKATFDDWEVWQRSGN